MESKNRLGTRSDGIQLQCVNVGTSIASIGGIKLSAPLFTPLKYTGVILHNSLHYFRSFLFLHQLVLTVNVTDLEMPLKQINSFLGINELKNYKMLIKQLISELLATFLFMTLILLSGSGVSSDVSVIIVALATGLMISTMVQIFGHTSGCHMNPAVTVGVMTCGHIKPLRGLCYIAMQIAGGIAGSATAYAISTESLRGTLGTTTPYKDCIEEQIFALEYLMTFLLVSTILSVLDEHRGARGLGSAPLTIGLCVSGCLCACLPYTGSLNPVRTLGPAVVMREWQFHWVYWAGPMLGGMTAGIVYRFLLSGYWE